MTTQLMKGKKGLIFGLANERSLAWGIAQTLAEHGAEIGLAYQGDLMKKRVEPLAEKINAPFILSCDVSQEGQIETAFNQVDQIWDSLDFLVHSISFSDKNELRGDFLSMSRENFLNTMLISCYSFIEMTRHAALRMKNGGSVVTLSYYGAEKVIPHYNGMALAKSALETSVRYAAEDLGKRNIRVNTLSCGPFRTLAASGIGDFNYILKWNMYNSPLRRSITLEDVGRSALYLLSDLGSGVTGETLHVDAGYHVVGMKATDAPDLTLPTQS